MIDDEEREGMDFGSATEINGDEDEQSAIAMMSAGWSIPEKQAQSILPNVRAAFKAHPRARAKYMQAHYDIGDKGAVFDAKFMAILIMWEAEPSLQTLCKPSKLLRAMSKVFEEGMDKQMDGERAIMRGRFTPKMKALVANYIKQLEQTKAKPKPPAE